MKKSQARAEKLQEQQKSKKAKSKKGKKERKLSAESFRKLAVTSSDSSSETESESDSEKLRKLELRIAKKQEAAKGKAQSSPRRRSPRHEKADTEEQMEVEDQPQGSLSVSDTDESGFKTVTDADSSKEQDASGSKDKDSVKQAPLSADESREDKVDSRSPEQKEEEKDDEEEVVSKDELINGKDPLLEIVEGAEDKPRNWQKFPYVPPFIEFDDDRWITVVRVAPDPKLPYQKLFLLPGNSVKREADGSIAEIPDIKSSGVIKDVYMRRDLVWKEGGGTPGTSGEMRARSTVCTRGGRLGGGRSPPQVQTPRGIGGSLRGHVGVQVGPQRSREGWIPGRYSGGSLQKHHFVLLGCDLSTFQLYVDVGR